MKFFLTIFVCSVVNQNCAEVPPTKHDYKRLYSSHYECVQKGLGESYSIIYDGELFAEHLPEDGVPPIAGQSRGRVLIEAQCPKECLW